MQRKVNAQIKIRRDTSENWSKNNPILASGELGFDVTNNKLKVGDGKTFWDNLNYINVAAITTDEIDALFE